jgi:pimeloyl-ACP methyl ester carboxylesterase
MSMQATARERPLPASAEQRLKELDIKLPSSPEAFGTYVEAVQTGNLLFVSGMNWKTRRAFWADRDANENALRTNLLSLATTRTRHVGNDPNIERYDPDLWTDEFFFLNQPGQAEIQSDLFYDYRTNVESYPKWQAWMREKQPRLLVIWGKYDLSFDLSEPEAYRRDVPNAQVHVLDAGHFALDTAADEIAELLRSFVGSYEHSLRGALARAAVEGDRE